MSSMLERASCAVCAGCALFFICPVPGFSNAVLGIASTESVQQRWMLCLDLPGIAALLAGIPTTFVRSAPTTGSLIRQGCGSTLFSPGAQMRKRLHDGAIQRSSRSDCLCGAVCALLTSAPVAKRLTRRSAKSASAGSNPARCSTVVPQKRAAPCEGGAAFASESG